MEALISVLLPFGSRDPLQTPLFSRVPPFPTHVTCSSGSSVSEGWQEMAVTIPKYPLVLTDGDCAACNGFVNFLLAREGGTQTYAYSTLQHPKAQELLVERGLSLDLDTMVMIDPSGQAYTKSTAVIRTVAALGFPYSLLLLFLIIPAFIRDFFYSLFAAYRIKLFGTSEYCSLLTRDQRQRFLQYNPELLSNSEDSCKTR